jgi:hypothetical protein
MRNAWSECARALSISNTNEYGVRGDCAPTYCATYWRANSWRAWLTAGSSCDAATMQGQKKWGPTLLPESVPPPHNEATRGVATHGRARRTTSLYKVQRCRVGGGHSVRRAPQRNLRCHRRAGHSLSETSRNRRLATCAFGCTNESCDGNRLGAIGAGAALLARRVATDRLRKPTSMQRREQLIAASQA